MSMTLQSVRLSDVALRDLVANPEAAYGFAASPERVRLDLDKSWGGLNDLLTRRFPAEPLSRILNGAGQPVGDDLGYGPGWGLGSDDVAQVARLLGEATVEQLRTLFDPAGMTQRRVYPPIWDRTAEEDDVFGYLASNFEKFRDFVAGSVGGALLLWIS